MQLTRQSVTVAALSCLIFMAGCGGVKAPMGIDSGIRMQEAQKLTDTLVYVNPAIDAVRYTKFILEPVVVYDKEDNDFGSIDPKERQMMADFIREEFIKAFAGSRFPIVTAPGPDVLKTRFTLIGLTRSSPVVQGLNYVMFPVGTGVQVTKGVLGKSGTFMGNAIVAVEFHDSENNDVVAALVTRLTAHALNFKAAFSGEYGAAKSGIADFMEMLRKKADEDHGITSK